MSVETEPAPDPAECWCCGQRGRAMVGLGIHSEVRICLPCVDFLGRQAWAIRDSARRGPAVRLRNRLRSARAGVIRRGWHRRRAAGPLLRWIGRRLP